MYLSPTNKVERTGKIMEHRHRADMRQRSDRLVEAILAYYRKYHVQAA